MNAFIGKFIEEKCICGEMVRTEYGSCTGLYRDKDGEFDFVEGADWNRCQKCGHLINSERIENAEYIGSCCY